MNAIWWILIGVGSILAAGWIGLERGIRPRKSTLAFWRLSSIPIGKKIEGYIYAARTSWYLKPAAWKRFAERLDSRTGAEGYHGKVLTGNDAIRLIRLQQPLAFTCPDQVLPFQRARELIRSQPLDSIAVLRCPCREQREQPCTPLEVCLVLGEPFVSFILDHQPDKARRITPGEAEAILVAEEERGHIHTAWFKDAMHDRFYAICNCCRCCCLGMESYRRGVPRLVTSGYQPIMQREDCIGCGCCVEICPFAAWRQNPDEPPQLDRERCLGCGLCVGHCPGQALQLCLTPEQGQPLPLTQCSEQTGRENSGQAIAEMFAKSSHIGHTFAKSSL